MELKTYTLEEVKKHIYPNDAWTIIHGNVYDVTSYLTKHPGGVSLLLNKCGSDATQSFENMFHSPRARDQLEKLKIGKFEGSSHKSKKVSHTSHSLQPKTTSTPKSSSKTSNNSKNSNFGSNIKNSFNEKELLAQLNFDLGLRTDFSSASVKLGSLSLNEKKKDFVISQTEDQTFELKAINWLTHDTNVYQFEVADKKKLEIPLGHHITVSMNIDGNTVKRQYTPITDKPGCFELLIKTYKTYGVSEHIANMSVGDKILARGPFGNFKYDKLAQYSRVCMYAAGTGITPHYQILNYYSKNSTSTIFNLLYSNKEARDILLKKRLDSWNNSKSPSLTVTYFLTRVKGVDWKGQTGRISKQSVETFIKPNIKDEKEIHLICGPDAFVNHIFDILISLEIVEDKIVKF